MLGTTELMVLGGIVILLFGGAQLPKLARSLGAAKREFQEATQGLDAATKGIDTKEGPAQ